MTTTRTGLPPAPNRPRQALAFYYQQHVHPTQSWYRLCQAAARTSYDLPAVARSAWDAWLDAQGKHPCTASTVNWDKVPVGAHLFYSPAPDGHVATYIGIHNGTPLCWTNDAGGHGLITVVHPLWFETHWAHYLVGWTEDNNGYDLGLTIDGKVAPQWQKQPPPPEDPPPPTNQMQQLHDGIVAARAAALQLRNAHPKWGPRTLTPVSKSLEAAAGLLNDFLDGDPNT